MEITEIVGTMEITHTSQKPQKSQNITAVTHNLEITSIKKNRNQTQLRKSQKHENQRHRKQIQKSRNIMEITEITEPGWWAGGAGGRTDSRTGGHEGPQQ